MNEEQVPDTIEKLYDRLDDYDKQQLMNYGYLMEYTRTLEKEVKYQNGIVIKQKEILDKIKEYIKERTEFGEYDHAYPGILNQDEVRHINKLLEEINE